MSTEAIVEKYMTAATKRFLGSCDSLSATPGDDGIVFEFSVSGVLSRLEVHTGNVTPTKVRSAFVELGMEIRRLSRIRDGEIVAEPLTLNYRIFELAAVGVT